MKKAICECGSSLFEVCLDGSIELVICGSCREVYSEAELCEDVLESRGE